MNLCWITLAVNNIEESLKFYCDILNLNVAERFKAGEDTEIVMLGNKDEVKIELICYKGVEISERKGLSIGFNVESLEKTIEYLKENNIELESPIISPNPMTRFFFVKDPNGIQIQFVEEKESINL
ncbi:VOC family protein [Clostridium intestinale]|uniref:Lactoylglutathione lyase n=1 Tax=Clostridium intestinale DSM 6191 TaxID=1121320 RepID=A0A1M5UB30_9CLOT|nr:VOC family protein [Clostridium intestinale]SHH60222.1 lactoylglutathione lyase [Clostridium intestinale DSM 6191]